MALRFTLESLKTPRTQGRCGVGTALLDLPAEDGALVLEALRDPDVPRTAVWRALRNTGLAIGSQSAFHTHVRKDCVCFANPSES